MEARFLSRANKIDLIEANLTSSPLHEMNCFKLTKMKNEINRNFLWLPNMGDNGTKVFPLVAWVNVCRPKSEGDLTIRKNDEVNRATMAKLGWRILTDNDNIWAKIIRDKYVKNNNFFIVLKKSGDSNEWKEIINHRK